MPDQEWYTLEDLTKEFGVPYSRIQRAVQVLAKVNQIKTRDRPGDNRVLEVHKDSIALVRQAAL